MHQDGSKEIVIITSEDGIWREEKLSFAQDKPEGFGAEEAGVERDWSPLQWKRKFRQKVSPGYQSAMEALRNADTRIATFSNELNYLTSLLPSDPTKLPEIALVLIEIKQRLDSIVTAGQQIKPAKDNKFKDFYGRFHIQIPDSMRTASNKSDDKIATAGLISDFVHWIGRKLYERTDADIREMKRVVAHLLNTTRQMVDSTNSTLDDMRSARKTGDIDKYIEHVQFIGKEQASFKREFGVVYDAYLKEAYDYAIALEVQAQKEAEARGEEFKRSHEEVSFDEQGVNVVEVESPPEKELAPLDEAEEAEKPLDVSEEQRQRMLGEELEDLGGTRQVDMSDVVKKEQEAVEREHVQRQELLRRLGPEGRPLPQFKEVPPTERAPTERDPTFQDTIPGFPFSPTKTMPSAEPRSRMEGGVGGEAPPSSDLDIIPVPERAPMEEPINPLFGSEIEKAMTKAAHVRFLSKLSKIAETENKYVVAAFMAKYSEELEETNPYASAALLKAAQDISND